MSLKVSCKGLNVESNNPQRAPATVLVGLAADDTAEIETDLTQVQGPPWEVKPLRPAMVYCTAWRGSQYKKSLESSGRLTMATC